MEWLALCAAIGQLCGSYLEPIITAFVFALFFEWSYNAVVLLMPLHLPQHIGFMQAFGIIFIIRFIMLFIVSSGLNKLIEGILTLITKSKT